MRDLSLVCVCVSAALMSAGCAVWQGAQDTVTSVPKTEPIKTIIEFPGNVVKSINPENSSRTTTVPLTVTPGSVKTARMPKEEPAIVEKAAAVPVKKVITSNKHAAEPVKPVVEAEKPVETAVATVKTAAEEVSKPAAAVKAAAQEAAVPVTACAGPMVVADFNSGEKPSNIGGDFGSWNKDPADKTQYCNMSFDPKAKRGDAGYAVRLDYKVDSPNPAYNGFWMKLNKFDANGCQALVFYVKGDPDKKFTTRFKVELKNKSEVGKFMVTGVTGEWQKIAIPLEKLQGLTDRSALEEFVIVFDDLNSSVKTGTIYIDDISFE